MKISRIKKKEQLKIDPSTAAARLRKELLFKYVKKAGDNYCFQCGAEIENVDELSIEHKVPWLDSEDPIELFFNLGNIAFSHLECNVRAARPKKPKNKHGTQYKYMTGCRCDECKQAHAENNKKWRASKR